MYTYPLRQQLSGRQQQPLRPYGRMPFTIRNMNYNNSSSNSDISNSAATTNNNTTTTTTNASNR